jgi:hypothetical protein
MELAFGSRLSQELRGFMCKLLGLRKPLSYQEAKRRLVAAGSHTNPIGLTDTELNALMYIEGSNDDLNAALAYVKRWPWGCRLVQ